MTLNLYIYANALPNKKIAQFFVNIITISNCGKRQYRNLKKKIGGTKNKIKAQ